MGEGKGREKERWKGKKRKKGRNGRKRRKTGCVNVMGMYELLENLRTLIRGLFPNRS